MLDMCHKGGCSGARGGATLVQLDMHRQPLALAANSRNKAAAPTIKHAFIIAGILGGGAR